MSERNDYDPGVPCWVENLSPDAKGMSDFYSELFGWELAGPGGPADMQYYVARLRGRDVAGMAPRPQDTDALGWYTQVAVESAAETADAAERLGADIIMREYDAAPAGKLAVITDPAGAVFCAWQGDARKGAELVNEPSAWSMSKLSTPDPEGAKAFYGDLFGWETQTFTMGDAEMALFHLPGYVGGEPSQPVARDVVAVMTPAEDANAPAQWDVDFWVSDADETARRAAELGGTIVTEPFEIPGFRSAEIADPAGGRLGVSQLLAG